MKSLELVGFKSFAKKTELNFKTPITAIVGPNGSGKSNVAEAFRFVLGEQSFKSMRGKKGEDLIWNGSKSSARQNRAAVRAVFDNSSRFLSVDFDEAVLERIVHRDGVNEYLINGSQVRLKDIVETLSTAHIGSSGHHIISQGEADRILNANPKERRAMIEDALGLKVYLYKKQESRRKLEKTRENVLQVENLRKELTPHLKFLKKQMEKIERSRLLKGELVVFYRDYLKREDLYLKNFKARLEADKKEPAEELRLASERLEKAKKLTKESMVFDDKSRAVLDFEKEIQSARKRKEELARELGRLEGEMGALERQNSLFKKKQSEASVPLSTIVSLEKEISKEEGLLGGDTDSSKLRLIFKRIKEAVQKIIAEAKLKVGDSAHFEDPDLIGGLKNKKRELEEKMREILKKEGDLNEKYEAVKKIIEQEKDKNREAEKEIFQQTSKIRELSAKLSLLASQEDRFRLEEEDWRRELKEAAVLVGRAALDYDSALILDAAGKEVHEDKIITEQRSEQHARRRNIEKLKIRIEELGGGTGNEVVKEHTDALERDNFLAREIEDLEKSALALETLITELETKLDVLFKDGILKINAEFRKYFTLMFGGGEAELIVMREKKIKASPDEEEILQLAGADGGENEEEGEEGLDIKVSIPNKRVRGLEMLSGGERALTSIALIFAVSQVNPPPFIILDETDAALDEANSRKYGDMIQNLSKHSQLILITHNRETMSRAGVLYGVTMAGDGVSRLLSIEFEEAAIVAK